MAVIEVKKLSKNFKVKTKEKRIKESLKSKIKPKNKEVNPKKNKNIQLEKTENKA